MAETLAQDATEAAHAAADPLITFEQVAFTYPDGQQALRDLNLSIDAGEFVAVLGANASGKSTLAKHINALLLPTDGRVTVCGMDTAEAAAETAIRERVGMVFQNPDNQAVASIVRDDVAFGPENLGIPSDDIKERVAAALAAVDMSEHASDDISELSGGQKQRVAIAGVLALHPDIMVLDEPGALLDVQGRRDVMGIIRELNDDGMTIILITHFMEEALAADHVVVLDAGTVALEGTPREVFTAPGSITRLRELHLDLPFSTELSSRLHDAGLPVDITCVEEEVLGQLCRLSSKQ
ncbi:MAG: energy-coupling factor transporter ATPase [Coriobacteriaceae bacterium]|nr:energy-coupling factor transporter ATPase [Coriobacteriaceae bacterium]